MVEGLYHSSGGVDLCQSSTMAVLKKVMWRRSSVTAILSSQCLLPNMCSIHLTSVFIALVLRTFDVVSVMIEYEDVAINPFVSSSSHFFRPTSSSLPSSEGRKILAVAGVESVTVHVDVTPEIVTAATLLVV